MINHVYQLTAPGQITIKCQDISLRDGVIVRPEYMALCHADQRYYQGKRDANVLRKKLPMALIHECCGRVVYDHTGQFRPGQQVVLMPNVAPREMDERIYENYAEGARFLSSGYDGFMQELVAVAPYQVIPYQEIDPTVAAITEFVSIAVHATTRFDKAAHDTRQRIGIWGDGSLAYVVANVLRARFPGSKLIVVGRQRQKLSQFSFVDETHLVEELPADLRIDHAFECCGGGGSYYAIEDIIAHIRPQGTLMLLGVSEHQVPIDTRMVLEKGLSLVGCSRSGRQDFLTAVEILQQRRIQNRLKRIIFLDDPIESIGDIHRAFQNDMATPFKTVCKWNVK